MFIDAALPGAGHHTTPDFLRRLATVDGVLPRWTSWWDDADVDELFPDADVRAEVEAEQPRMPLACYDHLLPAPHDWAAPPCGYLWFATPYDKGAAQAAASGWAIVRDRASARQSPAHAGRPGRRRRGRAADGRRLALTRAGGWISP